MNLHEYQGKNILESFGVGIQRGYIASSPKEALDAAKKLIDLNCYISVSGIITFKNMGA